jgi:hypothetical protein
MHEEGESPAARSKTPMGAVTTELRLHPTTLKG